MNALCKRFTLAAVCILSLAAYGCGSSGETSDPQTEAKAPNQTETQKPPEPIELNMWFPSSVPQSDEAFMDLYGNIIKKKFPHITPKFLPLNSTNTFEKMMAAKQPIDLMSISIGATATHLLNNGLQYDITELIRKHNYDLSVLEPSTIEIQRHVANGGIYGLPVSTDTMTVFYNRDLFDKFGVAYPKDGMVWDDLYELVKRTSRTDGDVRYRGIGISPTHALQMDPLSPAFIDPKTDQGLLSGERFKRSFNTLLALFSIPGNEVDSQTWSYSNHLAEFQKNKTIAMLLGTSALGYAYFTDKENLNWDVADYPRYPDQRDVGPQSYPVYFYVSAISKHKDDAFLVSAFLTSKEAQVHLAERGVLPVLKDKSVMDSYGKSLPYMANKNVKAFLPDKFAAPAPVGQYNSIALAEITEAYRKVVLKEADVNTALRLADENIAKKIAEMKAR